MMVSADNFAQMVRPDWLALHDEAALHPEWPVIDAHHHIWDNIGSHYMVPELLADLGSGHEVLATVHVEAHAMIAAAGPELYRCVNETEFVNGVAALAATGRYGRTKLCAGIVGQADLRLGTKVDPVLEAHVRAGGGRFRGIRQFTNYDADPGVMQPHPLAPPPGMLGDARFHNGFAALAARGLSFDACMYFHQLPELAALADTFPESRIIVNHTGGPIGVSTYAGRREEIFALWRAQISEVAKRQNLFIKLGWLGSRVPGFRFHAGSRPPSSEALEVAWGPYFHACIEAFGPARCMIESNFPVDKVSCAYGVMMNCFKRVAARYAPDERDMILRGTAAAAYRLQI